MYAVTYHAGRFMAYGVIGLLLGLLSLTINIMVWQKIASISIGILLMALYTFSGIRVAIENYYYKSFLVKKARQVLNQPVNPYLRFYTSGMINGLLPCGLTYIAAAGAIVAGSFGGGFSYMLLFGLGTLPALIAVQAGQGLLKKLNPRLIPNLTSVLAISAGAILILRGVFMHRPDMNQLVLDQAMNVVKMCGF